MLSKITIAEGFDFLAFYLKKVYDAAEARSVARIVFEDALKVKNLESQEYLLLNDLHKMEEIRTRLLQNEPVQYVLGEADFYGLKFLVNENVLIPRKETEELVHWILETAKGENLKILDIGTGSGCIAVTLAKKLKNAKTTGLDVSNKALEISKLNAEGNKCTLAFLEKDILDEKQWSDFENFDLIVSNPPYIPKKETKLVSKQTFKFEPKLALFVPDDTPLLFYQKIAKLALNKLNPGGWLFFECNEFNAAEVKKHLENEGFKKVEMKKDMAGKDRMIRATV